MLKRCSIVARTEAFVIVFLALAAGLATAGDGKAPPGVWADLAAGRPRELIVLYEDRDIEADALRARANGQLAENDPAVIGYKADRYRSRKQDVEGTLSPGEADPLIDYDNLPMSFLRFRTRAALKKVTDRSEVRAVFENRPIHPSMLYSLPFIHQPAAVARGMTGQGASVAVLDTGINYTLADFGFCAAPGSPAGCRVVASVDVTGNGVTLNTGPGGQHGTNVAGIVAGVAPGSGIAAVNVYPGASTTVAWVIAGIDWTIAHKAAFNITAMNMSLGDGGNYTEPCADGATDPFVVPMGNARAAGILPVASSGNSGFTGGIASPACVSGVVSVGAVFDNYWPTDSLSCSNGANSVPDQIPCFSNSAPFLTMLAPGAFITAGGVQMEGTSQASPHVAGAAAMARSAFPADTLDQTIGRLTSAGMPVTDPRNGILTPRLDLNAIAQPVPVPAFPEGGAGIAAVLIAALLFRMGKRV